MTDLEYVKKIETIWNEYQNQDVYLAQRQPLCYTDVPKNGLLIIGLNPSLVSKTKFEDLPVNNSPVQVSNNHIKEDEKVHKYHDGLKRLVKQVEKFSNKNSIIWGHLDLFFFRYTTSSFVKAQMKIKGQSEFYKKQINLTKEITQARKPKVILVSNAYSSDLIFNFWMDNDKTLFDASIGTYRFNGIPIFFSRMLSGQAAIDKGGRERLGWHIAQQM